MIKDIYIVQLEGYIGAYMPAKCPVVSYAPKDRFVDFCLGLREDFPEYRLRCVRNAGIEEKIRERIIADIALKKLLIKSKKEL